jgi:hypothetical protein
MTILENVFKSNFKRLTYFYIEKLRQHIGVRETKFQGGVRFLPNSLSPSPRRPTKNCLTLPYLAKIGGEAAPRPRPQSPSYAYASIHSRNCLISRGLG